MSSTKEIRETLESQICELEALQSVYPEELKIADHGNLADINEFISGNRDNFPQRLEYSIEITSPEGRVELHVNLPLNYPKGSPQVYARSSSLDRTQQTLMNKDLKNYAEFQEFQEPRVYSMITWTRDNFEKYLTKSSARRKKNSVERKKEERRENIIFSRYWIYSHHIYSNLKRKDIVEEARENSLTGFSLAGKPGIICVEGAKEDCEYWWQKIKAMNWHKILIKFIEEEDDFLEDDNFVNYRKFGGFNEISFPTTEKHNDMGQLLKYLGEHGCQHVFKEIFGIEGKTALPSV